MIYDYDYEKEIEIGKMYSVSYWSDKTHFQYYDRSNGGIDAVSCDVSDTVLEDMKSLVLSNDNLKPYEPPADSNGVIKYEIIPTVVKITYGKEVASPKYMYSTDCNNVDELLNEFENIRNSAQSTD